MINSIEFYCGMSREMKALKCSEMCVKTDDMIELITRLRQAEKDAARYRWLRDEAADADQTSPLVFMADECADIVTDGDYQGIMFGKLLDAAIDEAMQCK